MSLQSLKDKAEDAVNKVADGLQPFTIRRMVNYVLPSSSRWAGQVRPAVITQLWGPDENSAINLVVLKGQPDDFQDTIMIPGPDGKLTQFCPSTSLQGSVKYDKGKQPGTWHWPND